MFGAVVFVASAVSCKTATPIVSKALDTPTVVDEFVTQGGAIIVNNCNAGGHTGPTTGTGWTFDKREGCYLDCKSDAAMKKDYLKQLKAHRIYGDFATIGAQDPRAEAIARYFAEKQEAKGIKMTRFDHLDESILRDGSKWMEYDIQPGDILLNFNFGQPNHAGIFYSKRGISHTRMVVKVTPSRIYTFDGGWEHFTQLKEVNAQTLWLRPRAEFLKDGDIENVIKWAKTMEPATYDNALVDDWKEFRVELNKQLDVPNQSNFDARDNAFKWADLHHKAPGTLANSFTFVPPSGLYCSEGTAGIYSYLGFRQFGETAMDIMTAFSMDGSLPNWSLYGDALSGFGADSDQNIYMMHQLFFAYFNAFDAGRRHGIIQIPGVADATQLTFAEAAEKNLQAVEADNGGANDHIKAQLDTLENALAAAGPPEAEMLNNLQKLKEGLTQAKLALSERMGVQMNLSQAIYTLFYANKAYGPHTFFENSKYFELKGVFYNSNLEGNQALYISDWWMDTVGTDPIKANIQTTLYRIVNDPTLPDDACVVAEKAPIISTN